MSANLVYQPLKDIAEPFNLRDEERVVPITFSRDANLPKKLGLDPDSLRWISEDKAVESELEGWETVYEVDRLKCRKTKLLTSDRLVLMAKRG